MTGVTAVGAVFAAASLRGAILVDANLSGANFDGANLTDARLSRSNLAGASFLDAQLGGADLTEVKQFDPARFKGACATSSTRLPAGLLLETCAIGQITASLE